MTTWKTLRGMAEAAEVSGEWADAAALWDGAERCAWDDNRTTKHQCAEMSASATRCRKRADAVAVPPAPRTGEDVARMMRAAWPLGGGRTWRGSTQLPAEAHSRCGPWDLEMLAVRSAPGLFRGRVYIASGDLNCEVSVTTGRTDFPAAVSALRAAHALLLADLRALGPADDGSALPPASAYAELGAEVERLTRERDDADAVRALCRSYGAESVNGPLVDCVREAIEEIDRERTGYREERDEARTQRDRACAQTDKVLGDLEPRMEHLERELTATRAAKAEAAAVAREALGLARRVTNAWECERRCAHMSRPASEIAAEVAPQREEHAALSARLDRIGTGAAPAPAAEPDLPDFLAAALTRPSRYFVEPGEVWGVLRRRDGSTKWARVGRVSASGAITREG